MTDEELNAKFAALEALIKSPPAPADPPVGSVRWAEQMADFLRQHAIKLAVALNTAWPTVQLVWPDLIDSLHLPNWGKNAITLGLALIAGASTKVKRPGE